VVCKGSRREPVLKCFPGESVPEALVEGGTKGIEGRDDLPALTGVAQACADQLAGQSPPAGGSRDRDGSEAHHGEAHTSDPLLELEELATRCQPAILFPYPEGRFGTSAPVGAEVFLPLRECVADRRKTVRRQVGELGYVVGLPGAKSKAQALLP
jgi:hypothetical protein